MAFETKRSFFNNVRECIKSLRSKNPFLFGSFIAFFYIISSSFYVTSSMEIFEGPYQDSKAVLHTVPYNGSEGNLLDLSPSSPSRKMICLTTKLILTHVIDHQVEQRLPLRNKAQNFDLGNFVQRVFWKGSSHFILNVGIQYIETGVMPNQGQTKKMLYKTLLDLTVSELTNSFVPDEEKELVKALTHGWIHSLFQGS